MTNEIWKGSGLLAKLAEVGQSSAGAWKEVQQGAQSAWNDLEQGFQGASREF